MKRILISLAVVLSAAAFITACNKSSDSAAAAPTTSLYQGAGSKWSISIGSGSTGDFTISKFATAADTTAEMTVTGTFQRFTNQFVKMTVASSTGTGGPAAGSLAYGLEVPGYAFFLKPLSGNSEPIVMVQGGTCPSTNFNANWIIAKPRGDMATNGIDNTTDMFGGAVINFNGASSSLNITQNEPVGGTAISGGNASLAFDIASCSNGVLRVLESGNDYFDMYFTTSGSVLVKFPSSADNQIIFASPKTDAAVTQAQLEGTYSGLVFQEAGASDSLFPIKLAMPATGNGTANDISDVDTDAIDTDGVVFSNITNVDSGSAALPTGFFRADLNPVGSTTNGKASCAFSTVSGVKIIACTGYTDNADKKPFFMLARSR